MLSLEKQILLHEMNIQTKKTYLKTQLEEITLDTQHKILSPLGLITISIVSYFTTKNIVEPAKVITLHKKETPLSRALTSASMVFSILRLGQSFL